MKRIAVLLSGLFAAAMLAAAEPAAPPPAYAWKPGDVYRFEYSKTLTLSSNDPAEPLDPQTTEIAGVLILEISAEGTAALLRFDGARIVIPPVYVYADTDDPELQKDKNRIIGKALESTLKATHWDALLATDGTIHIKDRRPLSFDEWTKDFGVAAFWRKKTLKSINRLIGDDMGLKPNIDDQELLLCLGAPSSAPPATLAAHLHPFRGDLSLASRVGNKIKFTFKRKPPELAGKPYALPELATPADLTATVDAVNTAEGSATFDAKLGMLDTIAEDYTTELTLRFGNDAIQRKLRIQYRLKRLVPTIKP